MRCAAPHLADKRNDPAVVCVDQRARHAVSLVSGHLGGANALAREVAAACGAAPVITTATDVEGALAPDALAADLGLRLTGDCTGVNAALAEGRLVQLHDPEGLFPDTTGYTPLDDPSDWDPALPGVWVSWRDDAPHAGEGGALALYPPRLLLGMGCRRGTPAAELLALVDAVFADHGLAKGAVAGLASIDAKADEPGLLEAAAALGVAARFFPAAELDAVDAPNPSARVAANMGTASVAEAAALLSAGPGGRLIVEKTTGPTSTGRVATLAVALGTLEEGA